MSEELQQRLERALDDSLRRAPVDGESLLIGAHRGAKRIRRRRRQGAAVLAVAALAGAGGLGWGVRAATLPTVSVASGPSVLTSAPSMTDTSSPTESIVSSSGTPSTSASRSAPTNVPNGGVRTTPSTGHTPGSQRTAVAGGATTPEVDVATLGPHDSAVEIPTSVLADVADQVSGMTPTGEVLVYRRVPAVGGMQCNLGLPGVEPIAAVSRDWGLSMASVTVTVTAYAKGSGATLWDEVGTDTGTCRWMGSATTQGSISEQGFQLLARDEGDSAQRLIRIGDVVVGVQARGTDDDGGNATALAERTAQLVVEQDVPGVGG